MRNMVEVYTDYRCTGCHQLFFKGIVIEGEVEVKCHKCHKTNVVKKTEFNACLCAKKNCPNRLAIKS